MQECNRFCFRPSMREFLRRGVTVLALFFMSTAGSAVQAEPPQVIEHVIINTPKPYTNVVSAIQNLGGKVNRQFQYIDAIAADIPDSALPAIRDLVGEDAISRDSVVRIPKPHKESRKGVSPVADSDSYTSISVGPAVGPIFPVASSGDAPPEEAYAVNETNLKIRDLHAAGFTGKDVVVAVVDSGVKPGFGSLDAGGSVIGGVDFVGDGNSFSSVNNDPHGTFVSSLISGNARFPVLPGAFLNSINSNFPAGTLESIHGVTYVDVIGTAPEAKIFEVRIFGRIFVDGIGTIVGATKSTIIAALENVIQTRENFDKFGQYSAANPKGGFNIKVCNMSLGTSTTFAGQTTLEQLLDTMIAKDILPVVAAGDGGPSTLTISSPATSHSALAVGATNPSANERLLYDVMCAVPTPLNANTCFLFGPGVGALERPMTYTQTADFSSRGPTADGRILPDVMAAGFDLSQGCGGFDAAGNCASQLNTLDIGFGTSFSAPIVSGVAAVLRQEFPKASAGQIWNAIVNSADDTQLGDNSTVLDQGQGVVNAANAAILIQTNKVSDKVPTPASPPHPPSPPKPDPHVRNNIEHNTDLKVSAGTVKRQFTNLKAGQHSDILYQIDPNTSQVAVNLTNFKLAANGNQFFGGDDVFLSIHSAKTSAGGFGDYYQFCIGAFSLSPICPSAFLTSDTSIVINDPEPGIMRITVMGDWTNAGFASVDVSITSSKDPLPKTTTHGPIRGGDNLFFPITIPAGVSQAEFNLRWDQDWGHYPTDDLDMYLFDPNGNVNRFGATLNCPEDVIVNSPTPGTWTVLVQGFSVPVKNDNFVLSVVLDGKVAKLQKDNPQ